MNRFVLTLIFVWFCCAQGQGQTLYTNTLIFPTNQFWIARDSCPSNGFSVISVDSDFEGYHSPVLIGTIQCPWTNFNVPFTVLMPGTNIVMVSDVNSAGVGPASSVVCTAPAVYAWFSVSGTPSVDRAVGPASSRAVGPFIFPPGGQSAFWIGAVSKTGWNPQPWYSIDIVTTNEPPAEAKLLPPFPWRK